jgi:adhesin/invasin
MMAPQGAILSSAMKQDGSAMKNRFFLSKSTLRGLTLTLVLVLATLTTGLASQNAPLDGGTTQNLPFIARGYNLGTGIVTGQVIDAVSGELLDGIEICYLHDDRCEYSDENGNYTILNVASGYRLFETEPENYANLVLGKQVLAETTNILNFALSVDDLEDGQYRFVVTWDADPKDLDAHLWTPYPVDGRPHVYQENKGNCTPPEDPGDPPLTKACLDKDNRNGYGPETITILENESGMYYYAVQRYEPGCWDDVNQVPIPCPTPLEGSGAKVQVYDYNGLRQDAYFPVPTSGNASYFYWFVFELEVGPLGEVSLSGENANCFTDRPDPIDDPPTCPAPPP